MKIGGFRDKKLRVLCEKQATARKKLGDACAHKLQTRLAELEAADTVAELVAGNPHPLKHDRAGQFALELAGGFRLVFTPANEPVPLTPDGAIDWSRVTIVCIEFIGDYHD